MIKIFSNPDEAQKLCDDIHKYLSENCPGYSANCWQIPGKAEKSELYYVELPAEYVIEEKQEKPLYVVAVKLTDTVKTDTDKAVQAVDKLPADWATQAAVEIIPKEEIIKE